MITAIISPLAVYLTFKGSILIALYFFLYCQCQRYRCTHFPHVFACYNYLMFVNPDDLASVTILEPTGYEEVIQIYHRDTPEVQNFLYFGGEGAGN